MPQTVSTASTVSPKEHLEMLKMVIEDLNMNEASKITVYNNFFNEYDLSTNLLPKYVDSKGELLSCTSCLNRIDVNIPVRTFNVMLIEQGYLEERERPSNASKTGIKKYKILTKKGLEFGENQVCPNNPRETQPLYYSGKFQELYNRVVSIRKFLGD